MWRETTLFDLQVSKYQLQIILESRMKFGKSLIALIYIYIFFFLPALWVYPWIFLRELSMKESPRNKVVCWRRVACWRHVVIFKEDIRTKHDICWKWWCNVSITWSKVQIIHWDTGGVSQTKNIQRRSRNLGHRWVSFCRQVTLSKK